MAADARFRTIPDPVRYLYLIQAIIDRDALVASEQLSIQEALHV